MSGSRMTRRSWLLLAAGLMATPMFAQPAPTASAANRPVNPASGRPVALAPVSAVASQGGSMLRSAEWLGAPTLDPAGPINSYVVLCGMGETLTRITPDGGVVPWLAERVEALDPLRWRVSLRDGITFWNGRALDAEAARSSLLRTVAKRLASASMLDLASVEVVDRLTFDLITKRPNGALLSSLAGSIAIIHDAEHAASIGDVAYAASPMLTGPFIPTEFRVREMVRARRNEAYWQGVPGLEGFELRAVSDANARLAAILAGDVDIARPIPALAAAQARTSGLNVVSGDEASMYQLYFNNAKPPLDELAVRRAISLLIDRQSLVDSVFGGAAAVANGPYPTYFPFADRTPPTHDPVLAATTLDAAGWTLGSDGVRQRDGQPLRLTLLTYPQLAEIGLLATVVQSDLRNAGILVELRQVEQIVDVMNAGDFDAALRRYGTTPTADPGYVLNTVYASTGADNRHLKYTSPRLDALVADLNAASEPARRLELALQAQRILQDEVPAAFLLSPRISIALSTRVQGYELHPSADFYFITHRVSLS